MNMSKKTTPDGRILVVDDNKAILSALRLLLPAYFSTAWRSSARRSSC